MERETGGGQTGIHYEMRGGGRQSVILVHGLPSSLREWDRLALRLADRGYLTIALDLPGNGDSIKPARVSDYTADAFYKLFEDWVPELALDAAPVLLGHSFGGYLCLRYALDHPQALRGLVLINPFLAYTHLTTVNRLLLARSEMAEFALKYVPSRLMPSLLWAGSLVRRGLAIRSYLSPGELRNTTADFKRCSPWIARLPHTLGDLTPRLSALALPTLLLWGKHDWTLSPAWYALAAARLPRSKSFALNAGHNPHLSNFEEVYALVVDYLQMFLVE
jgi:pimeloyl-ACP methyl ester carboxylesterase